MVNERLRSGLLLWLIAVMLAAGFALAYSWHVQASQPAQETEGYCLSCHSNPDLSMTLSNGEELSLYVSPEDLKLSIHSPLGIECQACHTEIKTYPHPENTYASRRDLTQAYALSCQKCHSAIYEKAQDSMHAQVAAENPNAPVCTDCHGSHYVTQPDEPRAHISTTCSACHTEVYQQYKSSIHGSALIEEDNPDVPVCTDCHGVHDIHDPRTEQFRIQSPELCAGCHADAELMAKYGLPANIYDLYKLSWHGVDISVYKSRWPTIWHDNAVCSDCHGVHDIRTTDDPQSHVNPANMLATCQKCHPGVSANWTGAWTGHNEISPERTPWLYYVDVFYSSFTPAVLWIAGIYVFLQILRATIDRIKRSQR